MNYVQIMLTAFIFSTLTACQFALSPWETDAHCPGVSIEENIGLLVSMEQRQGIKDHFKVAIVSDPQQLPGSLQDTVKIINRDDDIDFVLIIGDLVETGIKQEFEWACKALSRLEKPVIAVIGNHDALSYGKEIWLDVFGPFDFSFTYQNTKFIAYNDNKYEFSDVPDRDWLAAQAVVDEAEIRNHTIGVSHIAPWGHELELSQYLKDNGYDHMLHGHIHKFDYWQLAETQLPHYINADNKEKKYSIMAVYPDSISIESCDPQCVPAILRNR